MTNSGINDPHGLASLAITSPDLAKLLATATSRQNLTKAGEAQLIAGIQQATQGKQDATPSGNPIALRNGVQRGRDMGQDRNGSQPKMPQPMASSAGATL